MQDSDFLFSIYSNDLIRFVSSAPVTFSLKNQNSTLAPSKKLEEGFVYYKTTSISTASFKVENHDNTYQVSSLGIKTLNRLEKYQVDVLGNISKVGKEKRVRFQ